MGLKLVNRVQSYDVYHIVVFYSQHDLVLFDQSRTHVDWTFIVTAPLRTYTLSSHSILILNSISGKVSDDDKETELSDGVR